MIAKHLAMALLGTALVSAPALAQTQAPSSTAPSTTTAPATTAAPASGNFMTQMQSNQWEVSDLDGLNVYNNANEKIGDISELIVDQSGKIQAVVIGVGGFLGMGEREVAVPFEQVKFMNEPRANATASNAPATTGTATTGGATTTTSPSTTGSTGTMGTAGTAPAATDNNRRMPDHAMLDMTKDQLKAAPEFKSNR